MPSNIGEYEIINNKYGSIILVLYGEAVLSIPNNSQGKDLYLNRGKIIFVPFNVGSNLKISVKDNGENFTCYQAMYNDF